MSSLTMQPKTNQVTDGHIHIRSWEEFKHTVTEKKPNSIVFILEQNGFSKNKELTTLKIIMLPKRRRPQRNQNPAPQRQERHLQPRRNRSQSVPERAI
jgi:hypothetical protein